MALCGRLAVSVVSARHCPSLELPSGPSPSPPVHCTVTTDEPEAAEQTTPSAPRDPASATVDWATDGTTRTLLVPVAKPHACARIDVLLAGTVHAGRITVPVVSLADQQQRERWLPVQALPGAMHEGAALVPGETAGESHCEGGSGVELLVRVQFKFQAEWRPLFQGALKLHAGDPGAALKLLDEAARQHADVALVYCLRSACMVALEQAPRALQNARRAAELEPNWPDVYLYLGQALTACADFDAAAEAYQQGLKLDADDERLKGALALLVKNTVKRKVRDALTRGKEAFGRADYTLAMREFSVAIESNPHNPCYYEYRAVSAMGLGKFPQALEDALAAAALRGSKHKQGQPMHAGYLEKSGRVNIRFKRRYFKLVDGYFLYYYSNSNKVVPNGVMLLHAFDITVSGRNFTVRTPLRSFKLRADTEEESEKWIELIQQVKARPTLELPLDEAGENVIVWKTAVDIKQLTPGLRELGGFSIHSTYTARFLSGMGKKIKTAFTNVSFDNVTYHGVMDKRGNINTGWKTRWFVLIERKLHYFSSREEPVPKGVIELQNTSFVEPSGQTDRARSFDLVLYNRTYVLAAPDEEALQQWSLHLRRAIAGAAADEELQEDINDDGAGGDDPAGSGGMAGGNRLSLSLGGELPAAASGDASSGGADRKSSMDSRAGVGGAGGGAGGGPSPSASRSSTMTTSAQGQEIESLIDVLGGNNGGGSGSGRGGGASRRHLSPQGTYATESGEGGQPRTRERRRSSLRQQTFYGSGGETSATEHDTDTDTDGVLSDGLSTTEQRYFAKFGLDAPVSPRVGNGGTGGGGGEYAGSDGREGGGQGQQASSTTPSKSSKSSRSSKRKTRELEHSAAATEGTPLLASSSGGGGADSSGDGTADGEEGGSSCCCVVM